MVGCDFHHCKKIKNPICFTDVWGPTLRPRGLNVQHTKRSVELYRITSLDRNHLCCFEKRDKTYNCNPMFTQK